MQKKEEKELHHYSVKSCINYQTETDVGSFVHNVYVFSDTTKIYTGYSRRWYLFFSRMHTCFTQLKLISD